MNDYKHINETIMNGDFSLFEKLNEDEKKNIQKNWTEDMWIKYMSRVPTVTEEELFDELFKIIDNSEK